MIKDPRKFVGLGVMERVCMLARALRGGAPLAGGEAVTAIRSLESGAMRTPEKRDAAIGALESYAARCRGTSASNAARRAIERLSIIRMLQILHDDMG